MEGLAYSLFLLHGTTTWEHLDCEQMLYQRDKDVAKHPFLQSFLKKLQVSRQNGCSVPYQILSKLLSNVAKTPNKNRRGDEDEEEERGENDGEEAKGEGEEVGVKEESSLEEGEEESNNSSEEEGDGEEEGATSTFHFPWSAASFKREGVLRPTIKHAPPRGFQPRWINPLPFNVPTTSGQYSPRNSKKERKNSKEEQPNTSTPVVGCNMTSTVSASMPRAPFMASARWQQHAHKESWQSKACGSVEEAEPQQATNSGAEGEGTRKHALVRRRSASFEELLWLGAKRRAGASLSVDSPKKTLKLRETETKPFVEETDTPLSFLYKPHTISGLAVAVAFIIYCAFFRPHPTAEEDDPYSHLRAGLGCVAVVFLLYCWIQLRDGLLVHPHPVFWRLVHGTAILYLLVLVFLLMQSEKDVQQAMRIFSPELGVKPAVNDKLYAGDCRVYTPEQKDNPFSVVRATWHDVFVLAHTIGWWGKAIMFRDWRLCWVLCILWELLEYSFQHILANFHECWWDHWILDVAICNFGGMALGLLTCYYLEMRRFDWTGSRLPESNFIVKAKAVVVQIGKQFSPIEWTHYEWDIFSSFGRFFSVLFLIIVTETIELSGFFLKYILWVPPEHHLNIIRLLIWWLLAIPALREAYAYLTEDKCQRLGANLWLALALCACEVAICFKFGRTLFYVWPPAPVIYGWSAFFFLFVLWAMLKFDVLPFFRKDTYLRLRVLNAVVLVSIVPLIWMAYSLDVGYGLLQ
ncbi:PSS-domain-containing protein [Balamuthia mandrillaris]